MKTNIAVVGGKEADKKSLKDAYEVGKLVAAHGWILITGGMGGVMEAASKGAKENGGIVVGILPGKTKEEANPYIDIAILTAMSHARNAIIVRSADFIVAVDGSYGTLSEIALALNINKPVVGINTWNIKGVIPVKTPLDAINKIKENLG